MLIAITREVSASLQRCELSFVEAAPIDLAAARLQHAAYCAALEACGCRVIALPAEDALPDAVFVEDVAVVLDEVAVLTRPGAASRRSEGASVATLLQEHRPLRAIEAPGTLDGGDVLRLDRTLYVGASARSNAAAVVQLRQWLEPFGYRVHSVPTRECLHLKSAVTRVGDDTLLINPQWVDADLFADWRLIEIDPTEPHAANAVRIGSGTTARLIYPSCFPRTLARLQDAGIDVVTVDVSELQKAEGAVTCCSILFNA